MIIASKHNIKTALLAYGEIDCAQKIDKLSDEQILAIGNKSMDFISNANLIDKMLALAAVEYLEGSKRDLKKNRRDMKYYKETQNEDTGFFGRMIKLLNNKK